MKKTVLLITVLFWALNMFSQEAQNLSKNPLVEILEKSDKMTMVDFEETLKIKDNITSAARACISSPNAEIEFHDLFKSEVALIFHFRDVVENQMYLFVGDQKLQNSQCIALSFKEVYENYKLLEVAK